MRICLVGHFVDEPDDAVKEITRRLFEGLSQRHQVLKVNAKEIRSWKQISEFRPNVVHCVFSPSFMGLLQARLMALWLRRAQVVLSVPHLAVLNVRVFLPWLRPDLALAQAISSQDTLRRSGWRVEFLPNGVSTDKFVPVGGEAKRRLRNKYGVAPEKFVILHVGPVKKRRNVSLMLKTQGGENQVIIVGRASQKEEPKLSADLRRNGCLVWQDYIERMEEVYGLADLYVFPTFNPKACVEIPLSVLEAMSCNLPVITSKFGGLPAMFSEGQGVYYMDGVEDLMQKLDAVKRGVSDVETRKKVLDYSWEHIIERVDWLYREL